MKKFLYLMIFVLSFLSFGFSQEMTPKQKEVLEKIQKEQKADEERRKEIETRLASKLKPKKEVKSILIWQDGIGLTVKNLTESRNLSEYEDGGNFDCRDFGDIDKLSIPCDSEKLKEFIWQHWNEKKKGYVRVSGDSVDAGATTHYFIEPNEKNAWIVKIKIVRWSAIIKEKNPVQTFLPIVSIEKIENKPNKFTLLCKDDKGKVVTEF